MPQSELAIIWGSFFLILFLVVFAVDKAKSGKLPKFLVDAKPFCFVAGVVGFAVAGVIIVINNYHVH